MPELPFRSITLLNNMQDNTEDKELFTALRTLGKDLDALLRRLYGVQRDENGQLLIENLAVASPRGDQLVLQLNKLGQVGILQREPSFDYANLDVGGPKHIFGIPPSCSFEQAGVIAGAGLFTWDTLLFNNEPDMFVRVTGNTQIKITKRGWYFVDAIVLIEEPAASLVRTDVTLRVNAINKRWSIHVTTNPGGAANSYATHNLSHVQEFMAGDLVDINSITVGTNRYGAVGTSITSIEITRVN